MLNLLDLALTVQIIGFSPFSVIGGTIVQPVEPINKSIVYLGNCTATLVGERTVVTAAHCLDLDRPFEYGVVHSAGQSGQPCAKARVEAINQAPGAVFNQQRGYFVPDILLLKLETPLCGAVPAALGERPVAVGEVFRAAGYGSGSVSKVLPTRLDLRGLSKTDGSFEALYADVLPANDPKAQRHLEMIRKASLANYDLAVGANRGETLCNGDSGGPVYREGGNVVELVGVNGAIVPHELKGPATCHNGFLQLYTPVAPYISWIRAKSAEWDAQ